MTLLTLLRGHSGLNFAIPASFIMADQVVVNDVGAQAPRDLLRQALIGSHQLATRVDVLKNGVTVYEGLPVIDGEVTLDRRAEVRGRCTVTIAGRDLVPTSPSDLLAPYGTELKLWRGVRFASGDDVLVSLGVFRIESVEASDPGATLTISGPDRSQTVRDAPFLATYNVIEGTNYATAIREMIEAGVTGVQFQLAPTSATTPLIAWQEGESRWGAAVQMAQSIGMELFFDSDGVCVMRPEPDPSSKDPVWRVTDGDDGVLVEASRSWSRTDSPSEVVVTGESTSTAPVRASALDDDPTSPTYYLGPFGRVTRFERSALVTGVAQAEDFAQATLRRLLGATQAVTFGAVPNPLLSAGDVVYVRRQALGIDEAHVIESLQMPLGVSGVMRATTRSRQVTP